MKKNSDYMLFKKGIVNKYYKLFPLYYLPIDIFLEAKNLGYDLKGKKEQAITALNNIFFKIRDKGEK